MEPVDAYGWPSALGWVCEALGPRGASGPLKKIATFFFFFFG
jgi:hypothetical protein